MFKHLEKGRRERESRQDGTDGKMFQMSSVKKGYQLAKEKEKYICDCRETSIRHGDSCIENKVGDLFGNRIA